VLEVRRCGICSLNEGSKKCITAWYGPGWLSTIMTRHWAEHQFQAKTREFFSSSNNQTSSEAHPATNPVGAGCCSQRDEVTVA